MYEGPRPNGWASAKQVSKNGLFEPFILYNEHLKKEGSGQI